MNIVTTNNQLTNTLNDWNVADEFKNMTLDEIKAIQKRESLPFAVGALNLTGGLNLGSIIRSAVIFGAQKFYIIGKKRYDRRSTVGAQNYIDIEFIEEDVNEDQGQRRILDKICEDYSPAFIEQGGSDIMAEDFKHWNPHCFIFGEEGTGIPDGFFHLTLDHNIGCKLSIDQIGVLRSLNVAAAAAIVMHKVAMDLRTPREWK
jgi:tRNA G18 (ribose-2'-O)-methylase SpoU